ncbi:NAD(P)/FAD-dependent oxidoreductase [Porifericola rhodea]|uniref:NAD(P)/FAD-dependent oxidoreductase n=1 Tax=Porifericola rhodea TaxID=930972 RepID=UPI00266687F0|nr:NAD(P)/FAD-dependent oxidoreductase [Porifericola rhodea]WKN32812.1 NAD(P)/FAD-dependent oxidoreductase [Porifericola rhodea]
MKNVTIVGGGLAGLINANMLAKAGFEVLLIEKKHYPFHKVCGEYISNEVVPFLQQTDLYPQELEPAHVSRFMLSSVSGKSAIMPLDLGGFGISRFALDHFLYQKARAAGVKFLLGTAVKDIQFKDQQFLLTLSTHEVLASPLVIGAYGKRSRLDKQLGRRFIQKRSAYIGVKYHLYADFPADMIALHNFRGGYCGISQIEAGKYNMCYLGSRNALKQHGSIEAMEKAVLHENPYLKKLFSESEFLFEKPEVINEISFAPKQAVEEHILMSGDTAGLITPLCGNGMAMAIHSAKILSNLIIKHYTKPSPDRLSLEREYTQVWKQLFARRLWVGRNVQNLFGSPWVSELGVAMVSAYKPLAKSIMRRTHGQVF